MFTTRSNVNDDIMYFNNVAAAVHIVFFFFFRLFTPYGLRCRDRRGFEQHLKIRFCTRDYVVPNDDRHQGDHTFGTFYGFEF